MKLKKNNLAKKIFKQNKKIVKKILKFKPKKLNKNHQTLQKTKFLSRVTLISN